MHNTQNGMVAGIIASIIIVFFLFVYFWMIRFIESMWSIDTGDAIHACQSYNISIQ